MPTNYIIDTMPYEHTLLKPTYYYEYRSMCFQEHQFVLLGISFISLVAFLSYIIVKNIKLERDNYDLGYDNKINKNDVKDLKETIIKNEETIVELEEQIDELKEYEKNNAELTETLEKYLSRKRSRNEYEKPIHSYNLRSKLKIAPPPPYNLRPRKNNVLYVDVSHSEEESVDESVDESVNDSVDDSVDESGEESVEESVEESGDESEEGDFDDLEDKDNSSSETSSD